MYGTKIVRNDREIRNTKNSRNDGKVVPAATPNIEFTTTRTSTVPYVLSTVPYD